jgi:hypothetical protein
MFLLPIRPPIESVVQMMLNKEILQILILSRGKTAEVRLWESKAKPEDFEYDYILCRLTAALRELGMSNVMAKIGRKLGPYKDADSAMAAAKKYGLKLGISEAELKKYMLRMRKINGIQVERVVPVALFELLDAHETNEFECSNAPVNQGSLLGNTYQPGSKGKPGRKVRKDRANRFWYIEPAGAADITGTVASIARAAPAASGPPIAVVQRAAVEAAAPAPVAARELGINAARARQAGTWNGRRRLGRAPVKAGSRDVAALAAAARKIRDAAAHVIVIE